jgi:hypothetical protein
MLFIDEELEAIPIEFAYEEQESDYDSSSETDEDSVVDTNTTDNDEGFDNVDTDKEYNDSEFIRLISTNNIPIDFIGYMDGHSLLYTIISDKDYEFVMMLAESTYKLSGNDYIGFRASTYKIITDKNKWQLLENELWILLNVFFSFNINNFDILLDRYETSDAFKSLVEACDDCKAVADSFTVILKCIFKKYLLSNIQYESESFTLTESEKKREIVSFLGYAIKKEKDCAYNKRDQDSVI